MIVNKVKMIDDIIWENTESEANTLWITKNYFFRKEYPIILQISNTFFELQFLGGLSSSFIYIEKEDLDNFKNLFSDDDTYHDKCLKVVTFILKKLKIGKFLKQNTYGSTGE
jgi:hypothetical protein